MTELKSYNSETRSFCHQCGRKLVTKKFLYGYDTDNGKELFGTKLFCPVNPIARSFSGHYKTKFDYNGQEMIEYDY